MICLTWRKLWRNWHWIKQKCSWGHKLIKIVFKKFKIKQLSTKISIIFIHIFWRRWNSFWHCLKKWTYKGSPFCLFKIWKKSRVTNQKRQAIIIQKGFFYEIGFNSSAKRNRLKRLITLKIHCLKSLTWRSFEGYASEVQSKRCWKCSEIKIRRNCKKQK